MAQTGGDGRQAEIQRRTAQRISAPYRQHAFKNVKNQYGGGSGFTADTKHIGGAGIAGTVFARIGQTGETTNQNRTGDRATQIRDDNHSGRDNTHKRLPSNKGRFKFSICG